MRKEKVFLTFLLVETFALIAWAASSSAPLSETPNPNTWVTDGAVHAIARTPCANYIGGNFKYVGPYTGSGALVNATTGELGPPFPHFDGIIYAVCPDMTGGWFVGGSFLHADKTSISGLAHVNADGTLDTTWRADASGTVYALKLYGTTLYVGGEFTTIGGVARNRIAAVDATTGSVLAWNPDASHTVRDLWVTNSTVYAAGNFTSIGGSTHSRIAAIDRTTGLAAAWDPAANNTVTSIFLSGEVLYAGGYFTLIGGENRNYLAAFDITSGTLTGWAPSADQPVEDLCVVGSEVYLGGVFTFVGGMAREHLAVVDAATGSVVAKIFDANDKVMTLLPVGSVLYVGGLFNQIAGVARRGLAAINTDTATIEPWTAHTSGNVLALASHASKLFVGGDLYSIGGALRKNIAAFDPQTYAVLPWNPDADDTVLALACTDDAIYAGGDFTTIGGQTRPHLARLEPHFGIATSWNPAPNDTVTRLALSGNRLYVSGYFSSIGGQNKNYLAVVNPVSGSVESWDAQVNSFIDALAVTTDTVYIGGAFTSVGGQPRNRIAAVDATTGTVKSWNPGADNIVISFYVNNDTVFAGGMFQNIGGKTRRFLAALDATTGSVLDWNPNPNALVLALGGFGNTLIVGGRFTQIGTESIQFAAAANTETGAVLSWNPGANQELLAIAPEGDSVLVGGQFTIMGGSGRPFLAEFPKEAGMVVVNVTPENAKWTLNGPDGFEGNGKTYLGDWTFQGAPLGNYSWQGETLSGYTTPAAGNASLTVEGGRILFTKVWEQTGVTKFYVSPSGNDSNAGTSPASPFLTIPHAVEVAANAGGGIIHVAEGVYALSAPLTIPSGVHVVGVNPGETQIVVQPGLVSGRYCCIVLQSGASIRECKTLVPAGLAGIPNCVLIYVPDATNTAIARCVLDGSANTEPDTIPTTGAVIVGGTRANALVAANCFTDLSYGLECVDSGVNVTRNLFRRILHDAVTIHSSGRKTTTVPTLGDHTDPEQTGLNVFRDVGLLRVKNLTGVPVKAEVNDWGAYTQQGVSSGVQGDVSTDKFVQKSIGPGSVVAAVVDALGAVISASANPSSRLPTLNLTGEWDSNSERFIFASVPQGEWQVEGSATGYATRSVSAVVSSLSVTPVVISLNATGSGGTVVVNVTPNTASWTLAGPSGFEGNGQTYTGDRTFTNAPVGSYTWTGNSLAGYTTPSTQTQTLASGGTITFNKTWTQSGTGGGHGCTKQLAMGADGAQSYATLPAPADAVLLLSSGGVLALAGRLTGRRRKR